MSTPERAGEDLSPNGGERWWEVLERIDREVRRSGEAGMTRGEIDAYVDGLRRELDDRLAEIERLHGEIRSSRGEP